MIESNLRRYLEGRLLAPGQTLDAHDSLVDSGLLDSLALVELVEHLESQYGVVLQGSDLDADNFESVARIAELVRAGQDDAR
jgi:acyl carrier protein